MSSLFTGNDGRISTAVQLDSRKKDGQTERKRERTNQAFFFFFLFQSKGGKITLTQRNTLTKSRWRKASEK